MMTPTAFEDGLPNICAFTSRFNTALPWADLGVRVGSVGAALEFIGLHTVSLKLCSGGLLRACFYEDEIGEVAKEFEMERCDVLRRVIDLVAP